jgi:DNA-binding SARP family transcriptional activator
VRFGILGTVAVWNDADQEIRLGGAKRRAVLGVLLVRANTLVPTETLVDELWGERPPPTAVKAVQVHVSQLRKILGAGVLQSRPSGYLLQLERSTFDAFRFEDLVEEGRRRLAEGEAEAATRSLREGLGLWRGPPLADLRFEQFARNESGRLEELRLGALEDCLEAELECGRAAEIVGELEALVRDYPTRQRLLGLLMLALYRAGRQADALAVYKDARARMLDELGLDPSQQLQELERAILRQDGKLDHTPAAVPIPTRAPARPAKTAGDDLRPGLQVARKVVTVLLCDVRARDGERLDPEMLQLLLARHFQEATAIVEQHGGTVEKLVGDELLAVFGVPAVREDDALRAVRAAVAILESTAPLGPELDDGPRLELRIGVNTGEVITGDPASGAGLVTGETVSVCKRLEQAALPGEILLGEGTHALISHAVVGSPRGETAFRLDSVDPEAGAIRRRDDIPLVGRERELEQLQSIFSEVESEGGDRLVLLVGDPGIGKSRLVREFLSVLGEGATKLVGRCPPFGEAVTFSPMREVLQQAGRGTEALEGSSYDVFAAVREILEELAAERTVVVVLDDVHWAEPTLLDLVEYLTARLAAVPLLLVCLARPQLPEDRLAWLRRQATVMPIDPLSASESEVLLEELGAPGQLRAQITETADGNPLFVEQLAAIAVANEPGIAMPGSIRGVLHARLDRLDREERAALECAAVAGRSFSFEAVHDLSPPEERDAVFSHLLALTRNGFVRPETAEFEEGFRFQHALIRDATYDGIPKMRRADLHMRMAERLETDADAALAGLHLVQAYTLRSDLGSPDPALAAHAGRLLRKAGEQAFGRTDLPATISFFERALPLLPAHEAAELLPTLVQALFEAGHFDEVDDVVAQAIAMAAGNPVLEARARVEQQFVQLQADPLAGLGPSQEVATASLDLFARHRDERGQCRASYLLAWIAWNEGKTTEADELWQRAAGHARAAGDERQLYDILGWRASAALFGRTPVTEAIRRCTELRVQVEESQVADAVILPTLAALYAMEGEFHEARRLVAQANVVLADLGRQYSAVSHQEAMVEMLADDPAAAEAVLRAGYDKLVAMGEKAVRATTAALLARAVYAQGRVREADAYCAFSERTAAADDIASQVTWRGVRARIAAGQGRTEEAETLALEAVQLVAGTDMLNRHGEALLALAETYKLSRRPTDAGTAARAALDLFTQKGNVVSAGITRSLVAFPIPK